MKTKSSRNKLFQVFFDRCRDFLAFETIQDGIEQFKKARRKAALKYVRIYLFLDEIFFLAFGFFFYTLL